MVQGMAFLSKKGFNPQNQVNRKQVWEAQQQSKLEKERIRRRAEQLKREREDQELCAARHNGDGSQAQLRFMYDAPPGMKKEENQSGASSSTAANKDGSKDLTRVQPGDDDATVAFRRMLAATTVSINDSNDASVGEGEEGQDADGEKLRFGPVLQGSNLERESEKPNDGRSALEKAVGRRDRGSALTLEEQVARFPQLRNAPMAKGMSATDVNVNFKPLGAQLRNVKCLACGVWGHSRGDRECQVTGWDPFSARPAISSVSSSILPTAREQKRSDPTAKRQGEFKSQSISNRDDYDSESSSSSSDDDRRKKKRKHRSKHKRKESRKRSRRHRSRSPPTRRSEILKNEKKRSKQYD